MRIRDFDWDEENENHIAAHGVSPVEVEEIIVYGEPIHQRSREGKFVTYGVTEEGRHLFIVFAIKGEGLIRVVTARDMVEKEKHFWRKRKGMR